MTARTEVPTGLTAAERETVIRWDEADKVVTIWSSSPVVLRKLARLGIAPVRESRRRDGTLHGREYRVPLADFRWGLKRRLGETQRQRLRQARFARRGAQEQAGSSGATASGHPTVAPEDDRGPEAA